MGGKVEGSLVLSSLSFPPAASGGGPAKRREDMGTCTQGVARGLALPWALSGRPTALYIGSLRVRGKVPDAKSQREDILRDWAESRADLG